MYNLPTFFAKDIKLELSNAFAVLTQLNLNYNSRAAGFAAPVAVEAAPQPEFEPSVNVFWSVEVFASEAAFKDKAQPVSRDNGTFVTKTDNLDLIKGNIGKILGAN